MPMIKLSFAVVGTSAEELDLCMDLLETWDLVSGTNNNDLHLPAPCNKVHTGWFKSTFSSLKVVNKFCLPPLPSLGCYGRLTSHLQLSCMYYVCEPYRGEVYNRLGNYFSWTLCCWFNISADCHCVVHASEENLGTWYLQHWQTANN